jgi:hypothetical protein
VCRIVDLKEEPLVDDAFVGGGVSDAIAMDRFGRPGLESGCGFAVRSCFPRLRTQC